MTPGLEGRETARTTPRSPTRALTGTGAPPARPRWIPPEHRPVVRGPDEVQFGLAAGGPIVAGIDETEAALLGRLDGRLGVSDSFHVAAASGVSRSRWHRVLAVTESLGLLQDTPTPGPAGGPTGRVPVDGRGPVLVDGRGPLALDLVGQLRRCGQEARFGPGSGPGAEARDPALVVLVDADALDPTRGAPWERTGVPHLPVVALGAGVRVGPLVRPGAPGPCLHCLDLHRADRDPAWPRILSALRRDLGSVTVPPPREATCAAALGPLVAGTVALFAESPALAPTGISVEVAGPWPRMDHRRWSRHPDCDRHVETRPGPP